MHLQYPNSFKREENLEEMLKELIHAENQIIKFAVKIKEQNLLSILDIKIIQDDSKIQTAVYRNRQSTCEIITSKCKVCMHTNLHL